MHIQKSTFEIFIAIILDVIVIIINVIFIIHIQVKEEEEEMESEDIKPSKLELEQVFDIVMKY